MTGRQRGSVVVEFLGLGLLLAVPLVYLVLTMSQFERASLAVVAIADETSRAQANASSAAQATAWRERSLREIARGHGVDPGAVKVRVHCSGACPGHGSRVSATVTIRVALPLMPTGATGVGSVTSTAVAVSPRYG